VFNVGSFCLNVIFIINASALASHGVKEGEMIVADYLQ
jgi:hypothetical protein